jgi:glycerol-3-phosphate acyltransferase PlsY
VRGLTWWPLVAGAYLLGSVSFSLIVVWALARVDLRTLGSGNPGATNVLRTTGRWPALLVLALDLGKGLVPVRLARHLEAPAEIVAGAALAAVLGHVYPIFFGFRGGKGVATGFGAFLGLLPLATGAAGLLFLALVLTTRYVSLGSIVGALSIPVFAAAFARAGWTAPLPAPALALAAAISAVVVLRHAGNARRLLAGTERRLGEPRRARPTEGRERQGEGR